jgi:selenocysteine lyase/cysteine desulfurase
VGLQWECTSHASGRRLRIRLPARFEAGTSNIADAVGLGAALDYLQRLGIDNVARYEHDLLGYATRYEHDLPGCVARYEHDLLGYANPPDERGVRAAADRDGG